MMTRRNFLMGATAGLAGGAAISHWLPNAVAAAPKTKIRVGSCVIGLHQAKEAGLDGVEIGVGDAADKLRIADRGVREEYKHQMAKTGLTISSFMMGLFNSYPLAVDPRAPAWLEQSIDAAKDLGAGVILVAFFGKGDLRQEGQIKRGDVETAVLRIKAAAPRAKEAGVILAIENTLSARQNVEILERIGHESVRVYYDVGNSTNNGYDVPEEIRFLKDRIACIHFKDGRSYLGSGKIPFEPIAQAIQDIGYQGWIVMETSNPSGNATADATRNGAYIRGLFGL